MDKKPEEQKSTRKPGDPEAREEKLLRPNFAPAVTPDDETGEAEGAAEGETPGEATPEEDALDPRIQDAIADEEEKELGESPSEELVEEVAEESPLSSWQPPDPIPPFERPQPQTVDAEPWAPEAPKSFWQRLFGGGGKQAEPQPAPAAPTSQAPSLHQPRRYADGTRAAAGGAGAPAQGAARRGRASQLPWKKQSQLRRRLYWLAFLLPMLLMFIAYSSVGFYPVGDKTPLAIDMYHQYAPFLSELKRKLAAGESLFYSLNTGLGVNFYALIAYYAASPLNFLLLLFPLSHLTEAIYLLTLLKTGLMGLTMAIFLDRAYSPAGAMSVFRMNPRPAPSFRRPAPGTNGALNQNSGTGSYDGRAEGAANGDRRPRLGDCAGDLAILAFAVAYALSAYTFSYAWCVMWLDGLILLPIVMLGLVRLVREGKFHLYAISLGLTIIVNYYIAVFVCLFVVLYFVVVLIADSEVQLKLQRSESRAALIFKRLGLFAFASLLGGALSAVMALPTYVSILHTSASGDSWPGFHDFFFKVFDFPMQHFAGSKPNIRDGLPNVYAGLLTLIILPFYLKAERISLREKITAVVALLFLFFSFNSNYLNFFWHGMHYPNQLPHRFAFVYVFFILTLAYRALTETDFTGSAKLVKKTSLALALYLILAQRIDALAMDELMFYINLLFLGLYALIFILAEAKGHRVRYVASLLLVIFLAELGMNGISMAQQVDKNEYYTKRSDFIRDFDETLDLIEEVRQREGEGAFYRMELEPQKTTNDPALYGYPGFTLFSSTSPEGTAALMRSLGYHGNNINSYKYVDSTPFMDALWGLKYFIWKNGETNDPERHRLLRERPEEDRTARLYENLDAGGLGYAAPSVLEQWTAEDPSAFVNQASLAEHLTGIEGLYRPLALSSGNLQNAVEQASDPAGGYELSSSDNNQAGSFDLSYEATEDTRAFFFIDTSRTSKINWQVLGREELQPVETNEIEGPEAGVTEDEANGEPQDAFSNVNEEGAILPPEASAPFPETILREGNRSINKPEIFDPGPLKAGQRLVIKVSYDPNESSRWSIWAAEQVPETYEAILDALHAREIPWTVESPTHLTGRYSGTVPSALFLSLPYDKGWTLRVNGRALPETEQFAIGGGLQGYRLPEGELDLDLEFRPEGFDLGWMVSLGAILMWLVTLYIARRRRAQA